MMSSLSTQFNKMKLVATNRNTKDGECPRTELFMSSNTSPRCGEFLDMGKEIVIHHSMNGSGTIDSEIHDRSYIVNAKLRIHLEVDIVKERDK